MRGSHIVAIEIYLIDQRGDKMLILHEGELLHTDSSTDILEHYGVKGMHWGTKKGKRITAAVNRTEGSGAASAFSAWGKGIGNAYRHPYATSRSALSTLVKHPVMSVTSPITATKMMNKKTKERLDGRANKRKEYLKKNKSGAKAELYKGLNKLNDIDKKVSKSFDDMIGYKKNGNVKEMKRYENSKYDSTKSKRKNNYSRSL